MRIYLSILLFVVGNILYAQAELIELKELFKDKENVELSVWKGSMFNNHLCEMYLAQYENEIKGYYRFIISGTKFRLEGSLEDGQLILMEYDDDENEIGQFYLKGVDILKQKTLNIAWQSLDKQNTIPFMFEKAEFDDYPQPIFRNEIIQYCRSLDNDQECFLIEKIGIQDTKVRLSNESETNEIRMKTLRSNPLQLEGKEELMILEEVNNQLRFRKGNDTYFYDKSNTAKIKKLAIANFDLIIDLEYPYTDNKEFSKWIESKIEDKRRDIRTAIARSKNSNKEEAPSSLHYSNMFSSWTKIDHLSNQLISGRIFFIMTSDIDSVEIDVVPFNYDFINERESNLWEDFRSDFDINQYITGHLKTNYPLLKKEEIEAYKHLSFNDRELIVTKSWNWIDGEQLIHIPFEEVEGLVRRNSILKTAMNISWK